MRTEGILDFHGSVIEERIRLDRAHIIGPICLRGATVGNGAGEAIAATGLIVDGDMECDAGFMARGQVTLHGARIAGQLTFQDAVLEGTPIAAHLRRLQADELCLRTARPIAGAIWLAPARVGTLDDDPAVWPPEIWLSGFTYDVIRHRMGWVPVSERIDWVSRGPFGYQPRHEQLADYYRRAGQDDDVRRVLLAKQRHRRTTLRAPGRAIGRLLDATVGYGYRPGSRRSGWPYCSPPVPSSIPSTSRMPCRVCRSRRSTPSLTPSTCSSPSAHSGSAMPTHPSARPNGWPTPSSRPAGYLPPPSSRASPAPSVATNRPRPRSSFRTARLSRIPAASRPGLAQQGSRVHVHANRGPPSRECR